MAGKVGSIQTKTGGGGQTKVAASAEGANEAELLDSKKQLYRFKQLHIKIWKDLQDNLKLFHDGSFNELKEKFSREVFNETSHKLNTDTAFNFSAIPSTTTFGKASSYSAYFNEYVINTYKVLNGLNRSMILQHTIEQTEFRLDYYKKKAEILDDAEQLLQYLSGMDHSVPIDVTVATAGFSLGIKPQYERYIELHGAPESGLWDAEKLAPIIKELLDNGTLGPEDVF